MKKNIIIILLTAATLILTGCQKIGPFENGNKSTVNFSVVSSNVGTKTAYGETIYTSGEKKYESINWKAGDNIRIWSDVAVHRTIPDQHWSNYQVAADGTPDQTIAWYNNATLANEADNGLAWGATGEYKFHAVYPAQGISADGSTTDCTIPSAQTPTFTGGVGKPDMSYAFMTASATATTSVAGEGADVILQFYPAFTAFEITLRSKEETIYLDSFSIQSEGGSPIAGAFTVEFDNAIDKYTPSSETGATQSQITVALNNAELTTTADFKFTVLALPETFNDLSITFNVKKNASDTEIISRTLKLMNAAKTQYVTFTQCDKHRIYGLALTAESWKVITVTGEDVEWDEELLGEDVLWDN